VVALIKCKCTAKLQVTIDEAVNNNWRTGKQKLDFSIANKIR
jgi:hypothetical protein